ncbi:hypothetical protein AB0B21_34940 [Streptomyces rimosus]|uniref:hypothetical protein n=1 Tax=Streptomyces rimosus TaxID=1927 RepID=UPI0033FE368B
MSFGVVPGEPCPDGHLGTEGAVERVDEHGVVVPYSWVTSCQAVSNDAVNSS